MTTKRTTTRTYQRRVGSETTHLGWRGIKAGIGRTVRYTSPISRFILIWFGAFLGVAAIPLIGRAFSN